MSTAAPLVAILPVWMQGPTALWIVVGFAGQSLFMMRFLHQWIASEKARRSVVPEAFWFFSLAGGIILLIYALHRQDPVFALGQGLGLFVYARNLRLLKREKVSKSDLKPSFPSKTGH